MEVVGWMDGWTSTWMQLLVLVCNYLPSLSGIEFLQLIERSSQMSIVTVITYPRMGKRLFRGISNIIQSLNQSIHRQFNDELGIGEKEKITTLWIFICGDL